MHNESTDPNDRDRASSGVADTANPDGQPEGGGTEDGDELAEEGARSLAKKRRPPVVEVLEALERILSHAENNGEVYHGAVDDHGVLRAYMTDQYTE